MTVCRLRSIGGVLVQLIALFSLHLGEMAPRVATLARSTVHPMVCRGVHAECGCSPERIASRTCCCYERFFPCCVETRNQAGQTEAHEDLGAEPREDRSAHAFSVPSCGGAAKDFGPAGDTTDLAKSEPPPLPRTKAAAAASPPGFAAPPDRTLEPPDPPPKASLTV